jgi:hypothetical protein
MRVVKMNTIMERLYSPKWDLSNIALPERLNNVVKNGVVLHNGCHVLRTALKANPHVRIEQCYDRTGYEAFLNHVHVKDFGDDRLCVAFAFLQRISDVLGKEFPGKDFLGIVSSTPEGRDCVARFHYRHEGEHGWIGDDLEEGLAEAVCLLDLSAN